MPAKYDSINAVITVKGKNYSKILALKNNSRYKRSTMKSATKGGSLIVRIDASDITALRATVNSVLRDLQVASAIIPINNRKGKSIKRYTSNK
ncbi:MAG: CTAG/PCC1 family protein [Candidatus Marsarchaeota archaeon]|jgi:tRNA threonylcarbamoyladenosine modification (KEOPS) complex  Pcc1 subunit|nr:CTAG/PCC1 family protein [Candidatus Marsarchaeota archaeon]MCL5418738.1 CTAG/PCC1 family protein [Candidatus Marsarchaeota archaeon]